jgi:hypothetical protein
MNFHVFFLGRTPGGARAAKLPCAELASDGSLWRPRFLISIISANDWVKHIDSSQTLVNLGHHLKNLANNH